MKVAWKWTAGLAALTCAVLLYGADDWPFAGRFSDLQLLPPQTVQPHEFTWVRIIYNGRLPGYYKNWYTDYPKGDRQLIEVLGRLTGIDIAPEERALPINHPDLQNYPFIYSAEAGQMVLDNEDAARLREYLKRGGFWMVDDFWGSFEWSNFEEQIRKVFPDRQIVDLPRTHPIFNCFFEIDHIVQVPNVGIAYCTGDCPTWEQDGFRPEVKGLFDDDGRLLILIVHNSDLMDGSEWADEPAYAEKYSAFSFKVFSNAVIYAMTH